MKKRILPIALALTLFLSQLSPLAVFAEDSIAPESSTSVEQTTDSEVPSSESLPQSSSVEDTTLEDSASTSIVDTSSEVSMPTETNSEIELPQSSQEMQVAQENGIEAFSSEPSLVDNVYQIGTVEELEWFRDTVNSGTNTINGVLTSDINLSGQNWTPIGGGDGYASTYFGGSFNGNGHTVSGLTIDATYSHAGLFGYVNNAAAIIQNLFVEATTNSSTGNVGGIVGTLANGTIQNCSFTGSVTSTHKNGYAGGIAGNINGNTSANALIKGCVNKGSVTSGGQAGGIIGYGKFGTITECYNQGTIQGTSRTGGIAGQLQNNFICSYCYNSGKLEGANASEITNFLYSSATLLNCGYVVTPADNGTGKTTNCFAYTTPEELLAGLGSAYKANGDSFPILAWESAGSGEDIPVKDPAISLQGGNTIFVEQGVNANQTTVCVLLQDIKAEDVSNIEWTTSVIKGSLPLEEIVSIAYPEGNNNSLIVTALSGGGVIEVSAQVTVGENIYTDTKQISVIPQISFAEVVNADAKHGTNPVLGELATVKVYTIGGAEYDYENYPALSFKWKYNTPNAPTIEGITGKDYLIPSDGSFEAEKYVYVEISSGSTVLRNAMDTKGYLAAEPTITPDPKPDPTPEEVADLEYLTNAVDSLGEWYTVITPAYSKDQNIVTMFTADLQAKGFTGITTTVTSIEEVYAGGNITQDGSIEYYHTDPNTAQSPWMSQYKVSFTLTKGEASLEKENLYVNIPWDQEKVKNTMRDEILYGVTEDIVLGGNDKDDISSDLVLPKVVDNKKWTLIEWTSSDPSAISIDNSSQSTSENFYAPYIGKVTHGTQEKIVTLTAKFNFQLTNLSESAITLYKTFTFVVPPLSETETDQIRNNLLEKIDTAVAETGFSDYVTKEKVEEINGSYTSKNDIQYPTTKDFKVDGKYFPVTITTSNTNVIEQPTVANAARSFVYRPLPGSLAEQVNVTITITDSAKGISASRTYPFTVEPITQAELDDATTLMAQAKTNYFAGINNNAYADYFSITGGMSPFQEVNWSSEDKSSLQWIYSSDEATRSGIIADEIDGWAEQEAWRAFRSSDAAVLDNETLHYTQPSEDTFVQIQSSLTHDIFGKYWAKFEGVEGYETFASLYHQPVSEVVMVEGKNHTSYTQEELENLRAQALANLNKPITATMILEDFADVKNSTSQQFTTYASVQKTSGQLINATVTDLTAGTTAFGLFRQIMQENNYTYTASGSYIQSITDPNGNTLAELDCGPNSGWLYTVNGKMPMTSMNGYTLKTGDVLEIKYTRDYTKEQDGTLPETPKDKTNSTTDNANNSDSTATANTDGTNNSANANSSASTSSKTSSSTAESKAESSSNSTSGNSTTASGGSGEDTTILDSSYIEKNVKENENTSNTKFIIILVIVIVVFLLVSAIIYSNSRKKKNK